MCKCGCGRSVVWLPRRKRWRVYAAECYGSLRQQPKGQQPPLCACGCGEPVAWSRVLDAWSGFRKGHHRRMHGTPGAWDAREAKANERMLRVYGITRDEYDRRVQTQGDRCACCGTSEKGKGRNGPRKLWCIDHDHVTGAIRGLLCHQCNAGIGNLGDNADGVRRALEYLTCQPSMA